MSRRAARRVGAAGTELPAPGATPGADPAADRAAPARRGDRGTILPLTIVYVLIAAALVIVAVDASAFFLSRRALSALADGASVAGTHADDAGVIYGRGPGSDLPLDPSGVRSQVATYLAARDAMTPYPNLQLLQAATDGRTVTVEISEDKPLRFLGLISAITGGSTGGTARITVRASARAPVTP